MPKNMDKAMLMSGKMYEAMCKIPLLGIPAARAWNRLLGRLVFRAPDPGGAGGKKAENITAVKDYLLKTGEEMGFPFEILEDTVGPDSFEFTVGGCPYGYKEPHQAAACDAAMEMDRVLFKLLGADLIIIDTAVDGAPKCKMLMKWSG